MLIKFFPNGKGAGAGPVGYLVAERVLAYDSNRDLFRDADGQPKTVTRDPLPEVLRGNPDRTEAVIDASRHQWTYRAGVISFADSDAPTEDQQAEVRLMQFRQKPNLIDMPRSEAFDLVQLCDGQNTMLCCDIEANVFGIVDVSNASRNVSKGDYDLVTTRHGTVVLSNKFLKPFVFDGFEWGWKWQSGSLGRIKDWFHLEGMTTFQDEADQPILNFRWNEFDKLLEKLSEIRVSSIFVITPREIYSQLRTTGKLEPMRPDLDLVEWASVGIDSTCHFPIARLDGAHVLSPNLEVISICNRIASTGDRSANTGSGTNAAFLLSQAIDRNGIVVKVSSDGPIKVIFRGQQITSMAMLNRLMFPSSNKEA